MSEAVSTYATPRFRLQTLNISRNSEPLTLSRTVSSPPPPPRCLNVYRKDTGGGEHSCHSTCLSSLSFACKLFLSLFNFGRNECIGVGCFILYLKLLLYSMFWENTKGATGARDNLPPPPPPLYTYLWRETSRRVIGIR